jgi:hypothetical protein
MRLELNPAIVKEGTRTSRPKIAMHAMVFLARGDIFRILLISRSICCVFMSSRCCLFSFACLTMHVCCTNVRFWQLYLRAPSALVLWLFGSASAKLPLSHGFCDAVVVVGGVGVGGGRMYGRDAIKR